jgi:tetratricopeptide (TPR) repeat protein
MEDKMIRRILFAIALIGFLIAPPLLRSQEAATDGLIKNLQTKAKMYPGDYKAYAGPGAAYLQKGRETGDAAEYELAKTSLRKSLDLSSNDPAASFTMTQMAVACMAEHRFEDAYTWSQKALALGSGDPSPWAIAGDALADIGDYKGAAEAYSKLQSQYGSEDEKLAISYQRESRMSFLRLIAGDQQEAIRLMSSAVKTATDLHMPAENIAWSQYQLGDELYQSGSIAKAEEAYVSALNQYPGYYRALAGLARVRSAQGRYRDAASLYEKAIAAVPYPEYAAALGDVYQKLGDTQRAGKEYEFVEFIAHLSEINRETHNRELAIFYADHDIRLDDAVVLARRELEIRHDVYSWDVLAWSLFKHGEFREASAAAAHALQQGTKDAQLFFHAGMIYQQLGDSTRAKDYLLHALQINPHFHPMYAEIASQTLTNLKGNTAEATSVHR